MKILHVSKADSFGGGASKLAEELAAAIREQGHYAKHRVSWSGRPYDYDDCWPLYGRFEKLIRRLHYASKKIGIVEYIPFELPMMIHHAIQKRFEILHFHDLSSAISPFTLAFFARRLPVVWTIHDCSPFTGGCLYPMDCERFKKSCGKCPRKGEWPIDSWFDTTRLGHAIKRSTHKTDIACLTPSQYMSNLAFSSNMFAAPPAVIANGVSTGLYANRHKDATRSELRIPLDRPVILLAAGHVEDLRKGIRYSLEAIQSIRDLNPFVIIMGAGSPAFFSQLAGIDHLVTGYLHAATSLSKYYSCADLFLFCSLADNAPLSVIEAMSCGTPIVGFKTGGIPEMVEQNRTGLLVAKNDMQALCRALRDAIETKSVYRWSKPARLKATAEYSIEKCAQRHIQFYQERIKSWRNRRGNRNRRWE